MLVSILAGACQKTIIYCVQGREFLIVDYFGTNLNSYTHYLKSGSQRYSARSCSKLVMLMGSLLLISRPTICSQFSSYLCEVLPNAHWRRNYCPSGIISLIPSPLENISTACIIMRQSHPYKLRYNIGVQSSCIDRSFKLVMWITLFWQKKKHLILKVSEILWYAFVISAKNDFDLDMGLDQWCWLFFDQEGLKSVRGFRRFVLELLLVCITKQLLMLIEFHIHFEFHIPFHTENQVKKKAR